MSAAQFEAVSDTGVPINGVVDCSAPATINAWAGDWDDYENADGWKDRAPQLQVPNVSGTGYAIYYYVADARDGHNGDVNAGAGWVDSDGYLTYGTIPAGYGVWSRGLKDGENAVEDSTFTFKGAVCDDDTVSVQCDGSFRLRALPYPKSVSLNNGVANWAAAGLPSVTAWVGDWDDYENADGWKESAAQIQVPNLSGSGYQIFYYVQDARDGQNGDANAGAGWVDSDGYLSYTTMPVGYGIWLKTATAEPVDIIFTK